MVAAIGSATDSNMNRSRFDGLIDYAPVADFSLLRTAVEVAERQGTALRVGPILAADAFYTDRPDLYDALAEYGAGLRLSADEAGEPVLRPSQRKGAARRSAK